MSVRAYPLPESALLEDIAEKTEVYIEFRDCGSINEADHYYTTVLYPAVKALRDYRKEHAV